MLGLSSPSYERRRLSTGSGCYPQCITRSDPPGLPGSRPRLAPRPIPIRIAPAADCPGAPSRNQRSLQRVEELLARPGQGASTASNRPCSKRDRRRAAFARAHVDFAAWLAAGPPPICPISVRNYRARGAHCTNRSLVRDSLLDGCSTRKTSPCSGGGCTDHCRASPETRHPGAHADYRSIERRTRGREHDNGMGTRRCYRPLAVHPGKLGGIRK